MHWNSARERTGVGRPAGIAVIAVAGFFWVLAASSGGSAAQTTPAQIPSPAPTTHPTPALPSSPNPAVMIDPAHGGIESGAVLNPTILEKDVTLAVAEHLRQDLTSRGIVTALVREGDANLSTDDRAAAANLERPSLYLSLHASSEVGALRIFSASLPDTVNGGGPFAQWESAQTQSLAGSRAAEQQIAAALQTSGFAVRQLTAPLRPLNNVMVPAIAIEFGPPSANVVQLDSPEFQRSLSIALANSIAAWLSHPQTAAPNPSVGGAATTGAPH